MSWLCSAFSPPDEYTLECAHSMGDSPNRSMVAPSSSKGRFRIENRNRCAVDVTSASGFTVVSLIANPAIFRFVVVRTTVMLSPCPCKSIGVITNKLYEHIIRPQRGCIYREAPGSRIHPATKGFTPSARGRIPAMPVAKKTTQVARTPANTGRRRSLLQRPAAAGEPLYRQLVQHLRADIVRGVFPVGSQLPTEEELAERFTVSRHTVREALRQLRADGLVSSRQGSGTTVMPPPASTPFNVHRVASIDELIAYAAESRYAIDRSDFVESGDGLRLDEATLPPGQRWLRLQGYRLGEDNAAPPICWTEVLVAAEYAGVERMLERQRGPIWRIIEDIY